MDLAGTQAERRRHRVYRRWTAIVDVAAVHGEAHRLVLLERYRANLVHGQTPDSACVGIHRDRHAPVDEGE